MLQTAAGCDHGPLYLFANHPAPPTYPSFSPGAGRGTSSPNTAASPYAAGSSSLRGYESSAISSMSDDGQSSSSSSTQPEPLSTWSSGPLSRHPDSRDWSRPDTDNTPPSTSSPSLSPLPSIESVYPLVVQLLLIYRQLGYSHGRRRRQIPTTLNRKQSSPLSQYQRKPLLIVKTVTYPNIHR